VCVWCQIVNIAFSEVGGKKEQQLLVATKFGVEVSEPANVSAAAAAATMLACQQCGKPPLLTYTVHAHFTPTADVRQHRQRGLACIVQCWWSIMCGAALCAAGHVVRPLHVLLLVLLLQRSNLHPCSVQVTSYKHPKQVAVGVHGAGLVWSLPAALLS
jgi:hypothetical protein